MGTSDFRNKYLCLLAALIIPFAFLSAQLESDLTKGSISLILGEVFLQEAQENFWIECNVGTKISLGDSLMTRKESRCEIKFPGYGVIRIGESSRIKVDSIAPRDIGLKMGTGRIWINLLLDKERVNIKTPTAVAAIRGTVYRIDCNSQSSTLNIYKGVVSAQPYHSSWSTSDSTFMIHAGEQFVSTTNVQEYIEQQEIEFQNYLNDSRAEFERFLQQDKQAFERHLELDESDFTKFKSLNILKRQFDRDQDKRNPWVRWNQMLDKE